MKMAEYEKSLAGVPITHPTSFIYLSAPQSFTLTLLIEKNLLKDCVGNNYQKEP